MSQEDLERTMRQLGAPDNFSEVRVKCKGCGKVHRISAFDWMEAIDQLAVAMKCSCGQLVGICRKEDNLKFVEGVADFSKHLPPGVKVVRTSGKSTKRRRRQRASSQKTLTAVLGIVFLAALLAGAVFLIRGAGIGGMIASSFRDSGRNRNNLKQFALALHVYADEHRDLPPGGVFDPHGTGYHGWQTMLLPFFVPQQPQIHEQIDFHVPWNDPANVAVFQTPVPAFLISGFEQQRDSAGFAVSHYAGNSHLFGKNSRLRLSDVKDGFANTLLVGEAAGNYKPWGHPENWRDPANGIGKGLDTFGTSAGAHFVMADGSVMFIDVAANPDLLRALATPAAADDVSELHAFQRSD